VTGRDDELLTVLEELRDRIVESARSADCFAIGQSNPTAASVEGSAAGLRSAARMVQDAINEHTPEPPDLDGEAIFLARPVSHRDRLTDLALEAMTDD